MAISKISSLYNHGSLHLVVPSIACQLLDLARFGCAPDLGGIVVACIVDQ